MRDKSKLKDSYAHFRMSDEDLDNLDKASTLSKLSKSAVVRRALSEYYDYVMSSPRKQETPPKPEHRNSPDTVDDMMKVIGKMSEEYGESEVDILKGALKMYSYSKLKDLF